MKKRISTKKIKIAVAAAVSIITLLTIIYYSIAEYSSADHMLEAKSSIKSGNSVKARQLLEKIISKDPGNEEAFILLAGIYRNSGDYIGAVKLWMKVQKLDPFDKNAVSMQALNLLAGGANKAVIELLEPLFKNNKLLLKDKIYLAKAYYFTGNIEESEKIVDKLLETSSGNVNLLLLKGNIELFKQNINKAEKIFKSIVSKDPIVCSAVLTGLANCAAVKGNQGETEQFFKKAADVSGNSFQADQILADYYRRSGNIDKSLQLYKKLAIEHPDSLEIIIITAELYTSLGDSKSINNLLKRIKGHGAIFIKARYYLKALSSFVSKDFPSALKYLEWTGNSFKKNPAYQWALLYSAIKTRNQVLTEEALRYFNCSYIKNRENNVLLKFLLEEASSAWDEGNADLTEEICTKIVECDNSIIPAHLFLMWCYFVNGKTLKAEIEANYVLNQVSNNVDALEVIGRAAFIRGDVDEAISIFKRIKKAEPNSAAGYFWLGLAYQKQRNYQESLNQLEKAFVLKPDNIKIITALHDTYALSNDKSGIISLADKLINSNKHEINSMGYGYKGQLYVEEKDYAKAAEEYRLAVSNSPQTISYYLLLARQLIKLNRISSAQKVLNDALSKDPVNRYALLEMALLKYKENDFKSSIEYYKKILEIYPNWAIAIVNLSDVLAKLNPEDAEALSYAFQAKKTYPGLWIASLNLGKRLFEHKKYKAAKKEFIATIGLNPQSNEAKEYIEKLNKLP
jgi:tetratricopeptide (TPR) repeat protein